MLCFHCLTEFLPWSLNALILEIERWKMEEKLYAHKKIRVWQNADKLDVLVQSIIKKMPKWEYKLISQVDRAMGSVLANFVEGYYSDSLPEYIRFCKYGKRSLGELQEHIRRICRKRYIGEPEYLTFDKLAGQTMYLFNRLIDSLKKALLKQGIQGKQVNKCTGKEG